MKTTTVRGFHYLLIVFALTALGLPVRCQELSTGQREATLSSLLENHNRLLSQLSRANLDKARIQQTQLQNAIKIDAMAEATKKHNERVSAWHLQYDELKRVALGLLAEMDAICENNYREEGRCTRKNYNAAKLADLNQRMLTYYQPMLDENAEAKAIEKETAEIRKTTVDLKSEEDVLSLTIAEKEEEILNLQQLIADNEEEYASLNVLAPAPVPVITSRQITVKSYIARMGPAAGARETPPSAATNAALGFKDLVGGRVDALALMYLTDDNFSENPSSGESSVADYRLWSQVKVLGSCDDSGTLSGFSVTGPDTQFGKEGPLTPAGSVMSPLEVSQRNDSTKSGVFEYSVKGRPNLLAEASFQFIRPRSSVWIWHRIKGTVRCDATRMELQIGLTGSQFPSHKVWVDGVLNKEIKQGPFENLWIPDVANTVLVK